MFRRRKRKNRPVNETQPKSPPPARAPDSDIPPPAVVGTHQETKASLLLSDTFKSTLEKAADRSRNELVSEGKIKPMAFFVNADGTMKTVSLRLKDEYQREAAMQRIQEKALAEDITTVIVLSEMDDEHAAVLSGVTPNMRGSACIYYSFDNTTKTVTSWKITWLNQSVQNLLIDGIFDRKD
jgi:hypothetical protein